MTRKAFYDFKNRYNGINSFDDFCEFRKSQKRKERKSFFFGCVLGCILYLL